MNLSKYQLDFLVAELPRMKFSSVMKMSQFLNIDFEGLMNIRIASKSKLATEDEEEFKEENLDFDLISDPSKVRGREKKEQMQKEIKEKEFSVGANVSMTNILKGIKDVAKKFISGTKSKLDSALANVDDKNEVMKELENLAKRNDDYKIITKETSDLIKDKGGDKKVFEMADSYVSLQRLINGNLDDMFAPIISKQAKKITDNKETTGISSLDEAVSLIGTALLLGKFSISPTGIEKDHSSKNDALENYMSVFTGEGKRLGGQTFISAVKKLSSQAFMNFLAFMKVRKSKDDLSLDVDSGTEEGSGSQYDITEDIKSKTPAQMMMSKEIREVLDSAIKDLVPNRNPVTIQNIKDTLALTNYEVFTSTQKYSDYWNSKKVGSKLKEIWGEENIEDFKSAMKIIKELKGSLAERLESYAENPVVTSSTLSQRLLESASSNNKIKLASKVSKINPFGFSGCVKVFDKSKPQFSHELFWTIDKGSVKIAEVIDVDQDHLDDAYQVAFKAVCEDVMNHNMLTEV